MSNSYTYGSLVRVSGAFTDDIGRALNPDSVVCQVQGPDGAIVEHAYLDDVAVVQDSQGCYHYDIDANAFGVWHYRWYALGVGQAADEFHFKVQPSRFD